MQKLYKISSIIDHPKADFSVSRDAYITGVMTNSSRNHLILYWDLIIDTFTTQGETRGMFMNTNSGIDGARFSEDHLRQSVLDAVEITEKELIILNKFDRTKSIGYNLPDEIMEYLGKHINNDILDETQKRILKKIWFIFDKESTEIYTRLRDAALKGSQDA